MEEDAIASQVPQWTVVLEEEEEENKVYSSTHS
jgi:hypothetical protein